MDLYHVSAPFVSVDYFKNLRLRFKKKKKNEVPHFSGRLTLSLQFSVDTKVKGGCDYQKAHGYAYIFIVND